jgi:hypothetical protein
MALDKLNAVALTERKLPQKLRQGETQTSKQGLPQ